MSEEIKEFLKHIEMFIGLSEEMLDQVTHLCQSKTYEADTVIIERGSPSDHFYLIQEGTVKLTPVLEVGTGNAAEAVMVTLGQGQSFGEMGLVDKGTRSATVQAMTQAKLLMIDCELFRELCRTNTQLGYQVMSNIAADLSFKLRHRNLI